ncbi:RNA polymerase sigma factor [Peristeroidobacter soli]|uniref:RNA polymerase sigma factor n=1 Tax=Peristeroidobacter soli TaxID=2497877 RepID=UPI00101D53B5|nr:RNA polymerase sigma factor [Peristeroidobacter soli]
MTVSDPERTRWFLRNILPHEPALRAWLGRKQRSGINVDDIVQEAYTILASQPAYQAIRHPRGYLFQIAHSLVVRHIRRARIVDIQAVEDLDQWDTAGAAPSLEQGAIARDELRYLAETIAVMPEKTREAFILRRVRGLSHRDIARQMKISESTVEKHIARGLRLLAERFTRDVTVSPGSDDQSQGAARDEITGNKSKR